MGGLRCTGPAWLFGWVVAVFLPSAIIALSGLSASARTIGSAGSGGSGFKDILATTWKVADDMGPAAKLMLGGLLLVFLLGSGARLDQRSGRAFVVNGLLGALTMLGVLLFLPESLSRGIGVGLSGHRLDLATLPAYLAGGLLAGIVFTWSLRRCAGRSEAPRR